MYRAYRIVDSDYTDDEEENINYKTPKKLSSESESESGTVSSLIIEDSASSDSDNEVNIVESSEDESSNNIIHESSNEDIINITDGDGDYKRNLKQTNLNSFVVKSPKIIAVDSTSGDSSSLSVHDSKDPISPEDTLEQVKKVSLLESQLLKIMNTIQVVKLDNLPDKGKLLLEKQQALMDSLKKEKEILSNFQIPTDMNGKIIAQNKVQVAWDDIEAGVGAVAPRTFGKKGLERFNAEKHMTVDRLNQLHKSLETCPTEAHLVEDPRGLKVPLMAHQQRALAWLLWREKQKPSGGILADDMGLGKTLTMISFILKHKEQQENEEEEDEPHRAKYSGGTLIVCPASLLGQWSEEVYKRTKRGLMSVEHYHGPKRETKAKNLAKHDMVITTYSIIMNEAERKGAVFNVRWRHIILDEAHQIRNHKAKTSQAVCQLSARSRWILTGTPIHNKEMDMFPLLKFLRCSPFDDIQVWKHWVGDKSTGGQERLHAVISSLMLRRTKAELMEKGALQNLPSRKWELIPINLEHDELDVYQKVLIFSRTLFAQFLHQRAEKNQDAYNLNFGTTNTLAANQEYFNTRDKLFKMHKGKEIRQHEILVLLLRLRQICCHPSLITNMLLDEDLGDNETIDDANDMNLLEQLNKLSLGDGDEDSPTEADPKSNPQYLDLHSQGAVGLKEASKDLLNPSHPIFAKDRPSSKVKVLVELLREKVPKGDKAIIVSQWTSLLHLIATHLKEEGILFSQLDGTVPVSKRMAIVDLFNNPDEPVQVLLLSLTAGGVGLNLVGANHLFLLDLHWNPQLENQAQDRIYRVGQTKPIFVYKLMAADTIEERIKKLQEQKLAIADSMLTGSKQVINSKLSLQDLKMLFDFK